MTTSTDTTKGPGRGRRAVTPTSTVPILTPAQRVGITDPNPPSDDGKRVFVETTDERVLALVHTFNSLGFETDVTYSPDGTKTVKV